MKSMKEVYWRSYNFGKKRECEVVKVNDNQFNLYIHYIDSDDKLNRKLLKGSFILRDESMLFQFAGNTFQMSGNKKYSASLKLIDRRANTWITVNADRKRPRSTNMPDYVSFAIPLLIKMKLYDILENI